MTQAHFVHFDSKTGAILSITEEQIDHFTARKAAGEAVVAIDAPIDITRYRVDLATMSIVEKPAEVPRPRTAAEKRAGAYPPLSDLADALYWRERGDASKLAAWMAACDAVKAAYPKGAS